MHCGCVATAVAVAVLVKPWGMSERKEKKKSGRNEEKNETTK